MNLLFLKEINSYHHNKGNAYYLTTHLITLPNRCSKTSQTTVMLPVITEVRNPS